MGEPAVSAHLKVVIEKLTGEALKTAARSHGFNSEMMILGRKLSQIQALVNDASDKDVAVVKRWLNRVQHLAYDIDDVLDDVATEAMHRELTPESEATTSMVRKLMLLILTCCTNFSPNHRLSVKLDTVTAQLQELFEEKDSLGLMMKAENPNYTSRIRMETSSLLESDVVGREAEKEKVLNKLLGDDESSSSSKEKFSFVPIVGMGGVGKTTLARLLYNDARVKDHFQLHAWVCVSDEFDIFRISQTILQSVSGENKEFNNLNQLQIALKEQFMDRRFLLVLDDVWTENFEAWENLVRPFHSGALGSKIIITTRNANLLKMLGFGHLDYLDSLSKEDALSLFSLHALGVDNFDSHPTLKPMGERIVEKCGGLPLALKAIGRLLRTKKDVEDWGKVLNSEIWNFGNDSAIIPALTLSYHDLSADLKRLFAYCSLFPKDFLFDKDELVVLWIAEGLLTQSNSTNVSERLGHEYFEDLLSRSFFQHAPDDTSLFVMHDLMHDLALFVAGEFFSSFDNHMMMEKEDLEKYRHMSFIREEYVAYQKFEKLKKARNLRTLLAISFGTNQSWDTFHLSSKILVDLLPALLMLRVLCLSRFEIGEVPDDVIGSLKQLRYLNLSQTKIKELPENVGNLYNLQTLIVFGCQSLSKLPKSFLKLKNLQHFDTKDTPLLDKLPMGIGELKSLQILTKIIIGGDNSFAITELKDLKNLHGEISIQGLHNVQSPMHAREADLSLKHLTKLELKWDDVSQMETLENEILNELKPNCYSLKELKIVSYGGTKFSNWVGDPSFHGLVHVSILGCRKCTSIPQLGQLPSLRELFIQGMDEVKVIGLEWLTGTTYVAFPSLEILRFEDMLGWETWSTNNHVADVVFPCLRELHMKDCPKLIDISVYKLPSLRVLQISGCGDGVLRHLVQVTSSITKLVIQSILGLTYDVWRGVVEHLETVEEVRIYRCNEIKYLWESEADASKVLVKLKKLYVYNCSALVSLGEKEEEGEDSCGSKFLSSLWVLDVWHCNNMKHCCCPNSIESLCIGSCSSLTRLSFPTIGGGQELKSLDISLCNKQMEMINTSMPMLEYVYIYHWTNLKSVIQLCNSIHLTHLELYGCLSIEYFPDLELPWLKSLKFLVVVNCPSLDYSFPRGLWPPKLVSLGIGGLTKPISEWGVQNFPTTLVELTLFGEDVRSFSELSHLLPSSLNQLCIEEFGKLESLSVAFQHLASLQHLSIENCPKILYLPETLLPSLLSLRIYECPNLKERCNGRGSYYWPLIYHIPCIETEHSD